MRNKLSFALKVVSVSLLMGALTYIALSSENDAVSILSGLEMIIVPIAFYAANKSELNSR